MGWTGNKRVTWPSMREFWEGALRAANGAKVELPPSFLNSPFLRLEGAVYLSARESGIYFWHSPQKEFTLHVSFPLESSSSHERLEARLELRDFLARFFPPADVEAWLR